MGARGPAPTPTRLRVLRGESRPSRINAAEPRPREIAPGRPGWLSPLAVEEWDRIAPDLAAMGAVKAADATAVAAYCEAVALFRLATDDVGRRGLTVSDRDGLERKNPAIAQARDASTLIRLWAREIGLTPAARQPLRVTVAHSGLPAERLLGLCRRGAGSWRAAVASCSAGWPGSWSAPSPPRRAPPRGPRRSGAPTGIDTVPRPPRERTA